MSDNSREKILKIIETLENNNIELEQKLFSLSAKDSEREQYAQLLEKQREMLYSIKNLNIKEGNLIQKEVLIKEKEKQIDKNEKRIKEKERQLIEKEKKIKKEEEEQEKKRKKKERQKKINNIVENTLKKPKDVEPKKLFEDISKLGKALKEEMKEELKQNPDKFIDINKELNSKNSQFFPSAVLANNLQKEGIFTLVEKDAKQSPLQDISIKFILNGMINQKKIIVNYDFGPEENHKILNNNEYQKDFIEKEYEKLSNLLKISKECINICNFGTDTVQYELLINENFANKDKYLDPFLSTDSNFDDLINKLNEYSTTENSKINVKLSPLLEAMKLNTDLFDYRGNKDSGWSEGQTRGGMQYDPPIGWSGHGLKVLQKYENDDWIGNKGGEGEWCVAYHGTNINFAESILKSKLLPGTRQAHKLCNNRNKKCSEEKVGIGIYVTPKIKIAEDYSVANNNYKCIFMCRINPTKFRTCDFDYWVVNPEDTDIRPYRLLIKKCT